MRPHVVSHRSLHGPVVAARPLARVIRFIGDRFLVLPIGAVIALVWANTAAESYFRFAHALAFPVNEIGMAVFLALIAQEIFDAVLPGGPLHTWRHWTLPLVAAVGGLLGATGIFLAYVNWQHELVLSPAWPIAGAIDVAAGYYVLRMVCRRTAALAFMLVTAAATNLFLVAAMALRRPVELHPGGAMLLLGAIGLAAVFRTRRVRAFWPYLAIAGTLSWTACRMLGIYPALALVPIVPFLPHARRWLNVFADPPDDSPVHHAEHVWNGAAQVALFLFGLVNAGVILKGYDTGTWAVLAAALVGRPLGILTAVALASLAGLPLPKHLGWREIVVIALATSSGFTFALFMATGLLPVGAVMAQIKVGALATVAGALLAAGAAWMLGAGQPRRASPSGVR
jgi:NhaA family Na+:H+ antiporter